jgi:hypothetical protein
MNQRVEAAFGDRQVAVEADYVAFRAPDGVERQFALQNVESVVRSQHVFAFQVNSKVYGVLYRPDDAQQALVIQTLIERLNQLHGNSQY